MIYPGLLFIPGFFILVSSFGQHVYPSLGLVTAVGCFAAFFLQAWRLMGVVLATSLAFGFWVGEPHLGSITISNLVGWALISTALASRCPGCEYPIAPTRNPWRQTPPKEWCPMCGRSRKGVWPFQYPFKPEAWDGEYHDKGGGPASDDSILDWWRDILFKRKQKQSKRGQ